MFRILRPLLSWCFLLFRLASRKTAADDAPPDTLGLFPDLLGLGPELVGPGDEIIQRAAHAEVELLGAYEGLGGVAARLLPFQE